MDCIPAETTVSGYDENRAWFGANYNMNIYKVCSHGCIYRDRRGKGIVGMGAMSDPDNHFEKQLQLTGGALNIINRLGSGVWIYYQYLFFA